MKKSFTLIELLVVISIMVIFIGSTLVQYNTYTEQTKLKNEGKKLVDVLELAKKKALGADLVDKNCTNFTGYRVRITPATNSYSLRFCCALSCSVVQNYNLATNITITTGTINYNFPPLMADPKFTVSDILLRNSFIDKSVKVTISPIGIVELDETLL